MDALHLHDHEVVQPGHGLEVPEGLRFPHEVLDRADLSDRRKREILSAWASDACAVDSFPTLRHLPGTPFPVLFSSIVDMRDRLDAQILARETVAMAGRTKGESDARGS